MSSNDAKAFKTWYVLSNALSQSSSFLVLIYICMQHSIITYYVVKSCVMKQHVHVCMTHMRMARSTVGIAIIL